MKGNLITIKLVIMVCNQKKNWWLWFKCSFIYTMMLFRNCRII